MLSDLRKKRRSAIAKVRDKFGSGAGFELLVYLSDRNVYGQIVELMNQRVLFSVSSVGGDKNVNKRNIKNESHPFIFIINFNNINI